MPLQRLHCSQLSTPWSGFFTHGVTLHRKRAGEEASRTFGESVGWAFCHGNLYAYGRSYLHDSLTVLEKAHRPETSLWPCDTFSEREHLVEEFQETHRSRFVFRVG